MKVLKTYQLFLKNMSLKIISLFCFLPALFLIASCRESADPGYIPRDSAFVPEADTQEARAPRPVLKDSSLRYDTILIEGRRQPVKLNPYVEPNYGVRTYIPARDFTPELSASGEGMSVKFVANFGGMKNPEASVNVFFPVGEPGIDQLRDMTIGPRGLLAMNKWRLIKSFKKPAVPYAWAQEQYTFQHKDGSKYSSGSVLIGESQGRPMQVIIIYPAEYSDGFMARAGILLKHLKISALAEPGF